MNKLAILTSCCLLTACGASGEPDATESFDTESVVTSLQIEGDAGSVTILSGDDEFGHIDVEIWGAKTVVTADHDDDGALLLRTDCNGGLQCAVNYTVTVPANTPVDIDNGSGSVDVSGIESDILVDTGSGGIHVTACGCEGATMVLDTGSGGIAVENFHGNSLSMDTGSGGVRATGLTVPDTLADTGSGGVHLAWTEAPMSVEVQTGSGSCDIEVPSEEYDVDIDTGSGGVDVDGITVSSAATRTIQVRTGSGGVQVQGF